MPCLADGIRNGLTFDQMLAKNAPLLSPIWYAAPALTSNHIGSVLRGIGHYAGEQHRARLLLDNPAEKRMVDDHLERRRSRSKSRANAYARGCRGFSAFLIHFHVCLVFNVVDSQPPWWRMNSRKISLRAECDTHPHRYERIVEFSTVS